MQPNKNDLYKDDLSKMEFNGVVVDDQDPLNLGRARVRVFGKFDQLSNEDLPWAMPVRGISFGSSGGSGQYSSPRKDAIVRVRFNNGNIYSPEIVGMQELAPALVQVINGSPVNAHSVIFDDDEKVYIYYTQKNGINIVLKNSSINIANDANNTVTIQSNNNASIIEATGGTVNVTTDSQVNVTAGSRVHVSSPEVYIDGKKTELGHVPSYSAVLGEPLFAFLNVMAATVDAKQYSTPGAMASACAQAKQLSLSQTVTVSK